MSHDHLPLDKSALNFTQVKNLLALNQPVSITASATKSINECRDYLDKKLNSGDGLFYGINTGFGYLQNVKIDNTQLHQLQSNLLQSHACGLGEEVPAAIVKLMMMLKIKSLSYGHSGVQLDTVNRLVDMYNNDVLPVIYTQGSLGASGDLAPLSHLSLPLIGLGEVNHAGKKYATKDILKNFGWEPITLQSKEGLSVKILCIGVGVHMPVFSVRKHRKLHHKRLPICVHAIEYNIILRVLLISSGIHDADKLCLVIR